MDKKTSDVAIIIVNWNSGRLLGISLDALEEQTIPPKRTIIIDNASSDGSADGMENRNLSVEIVRLDKNIGFAAANNIGAKMADGCQWLALLNPDAFPESTWLENLLKSAGSHPQFSFFSSRMLKADETGIMDGTGDIYHVSGLVWRRDHGVHLDMADRQTGEVFSPCAAAAMYRTRDFLKAGGFDENYFCYSEDVDLGFRLRLDGGCCLHVDDAVVAHVGSATNARHSDFQLYHGHRNLVWTFVKNMPWPLFWLYLPQHLILNIIAVIFFSLRGKAPIILKSKWDAIMGIPSALRKRKKIQKSRRVGSLKLRLAMLKGFLSAYTRGNR